MLLCVPIQNQSSAFCNASISFPNANYYVSRTNALKKSTSCKNKVLRGPRRRPREEAARRQPGALARIGS